MSSSVLSKRMAGPVWANHILFKHNTKPGTITVPYPAKDLLAGILKNIEKASGLKLR
jgi:hypothetical protein